MYASNYTELVLNVLMVRTGIETDYLLNFNASLPSQSKLIPNS